MLIEASAEKDTMPTVDAHTTDPTHVDVALRERRKFPRIKVGIPVEFKSGGAEYWTRTQTSDISCGGCYIESNFTLPVETRLDMVLWINDERLDTKGVVVTHHPSFGNGIQFVDMAVQDLNRLNRFLHSALR